MKLVYQIKEGSFETKELPSGRFRLMAKVHGPREVLYIEFDKQDASLLQYCLQLERVSETGSQSGGKK